MCSRRPLGLVVAVCVAACATAGPPEAEPDPDAMIIHLMIDASGPPPHIDATVQPPPPPPPPDAAPPTCTPTWANLLANTAFDLGPSSWTESSSGGFTIVTPSASLPIAPHSGNYAAWMGGYDNAYDQLYQMVTVPASATSLRMSGWRCFASEELPSGEFDVAGIGILDASATPLETLVAFSNLDASSATSCAWTPFSRNATGVYAGQNVIFFLEAATDFSLGTSFFFDSFVFEALVCQ